jgi:hypothetical protein
LAATQVHADGSSWRALLVVFDELKLALPRPWFGRRRFHHRLTSQEKSDALRSFEGFPELAAKLSNGAVHIQTQIRDAGAALGQLTCNAPDSYWPAPANVADQLDALAPPGSFDSVFILWPQQDSATGTRIPSCGWGFGMGSTRWSKTYATVANAPTFAWQGEPAGEVWLHEWLHGVCQFFAGFGYSMPSRDADGAEIHGYIRSDEAGWTTYYRDLMTAAVRENGTTSGIPRAAWAAHNQPV